MGRKRKYFTEEEAREAQNRRRRKDYLFAKQFDLTRANVILAEELFKYYYDPKQINVKYGTIDIHDVYIYAIIGVDATISSLVQKLYGFGNRSIKSSSINNKTLERIACQLRFREWLIDKSNLVVAKHNNSTLKKDKNQTKSI